MAAADQKPPDSSPLMGGLHRRPLPPPAIAFSSAEGRQIFREALMEGTAEIFYPLIEQFHTQAEPAFCGLATLVMVLNALNVDPGAMWKGPWRWHHEMALDCCKDVQEVMKDGIDWEEWLCLAKCQGLAVEATRADEDGASLAAFEAQVAEAASTTCGKILVVSYSRKSVAQSGDGHYSPIGAYHRGRSMALVLDTARFKYPPHWLPVAKLWEAMQRIDSSTCRSRGFAILQRADVCARGLFALKATTQPWKTVVPWTAEKLPELVSGCQATVETELWVFARALPPDMASLVSETTSAAGISGFSDVGNADDHVVVREALHKTAAFKALDAASRARPNEALPASKESLALLVLLLGRLGLLSQALPNAQKAGVWEAAGTKTSGGDFGEAPAERAPDMLEEELQYLQMQAEALLADSRSGVCCDRGACKPCCK